VKEERSGDKLRVTPLHWAVLASSVDAVRLLVEAGADPNAVATEGLTPLHLAASESVGREITRLLLATGAKTDAKDRRGRTPLDIAKSRWATEVIEELLAQGGKCQRE